MMMKKKTNRAKHYSSPLLDEILDSITPLEMNQARIRMTLAARIDECRQEADLSKIEFARKLNKQPSEISKWLSGTHNFTTDTLTEIAFVLKVKVESLYILHQETAIKSNELSLQSSNQEPIVLLITPTKSEKRTSSKFTLKTDTEEISPFYKRYNA
jgi:transcriptional regulator with XRE-family HTH domain